MSHYRYIHQCQACNKVYTNYSYQIHADLYFYGICPKCGTKGKFLRVVAKPKLFGLLGWIVKEKES